MYKKYFLTSNKTPIILQKDKFYKIRTIPEMLI